MSRSSRNLVILVLMVVLWESISLIRNRLGNQLITISAIDMHRHLELLELVRKKEVALQAYLLSTPMILNYGTQSRRV